MYDETEIDNCLVGQKDHILQLINNNKLFDAATCLSIVHNMWIATDYDYKFNEIVQRLREHKNVNNVQYTRIDTKFESSFLVLDTVDGDFVFRLT